jgi:hypothetical protein
MPSKLKRSKATKSPPEVWVSPDLMRKLKGAHEDRAGHVPHSPYLALADRFLGIMPGDSSGSKGAPRSGPGHIQKPREATAPPVPARAIAAAAATGAGTGSNTVLGSLPPRIDYPKPPARPAVPKPPKFIMSGLPSRPNPPKLHPPKPPKQSFGYRRRKVDRAE